MKNLINIVGVVVLLGILIKLSYVFVYFFGILDGSSVLSKATGITFAFASIYFVVKVDKMWLKVLMIGLDVCTILYFYLHTLFNLSIAPAALIVAAYSGVIIFFLGSIVSAQLTNGTNTDTNRVRKLEERLRIVTELRKIETELPCARRREKDSKTEATRATHHEQVVKLEQRYDALNGQLTMDNGQ